MLLTFESVDEILQSNHSNETSPAVLSRGTTVEALVKRPPREFRKVVAIRAAGRLREWALVSDHMMKQ